jgi:hypothetical protein
MVLAAAMLLSVAGMVRSQATNPASRPTLMMGDLVKVDGKKLIVSVRPREGAPYEVTVTTDETTDFNVDYELGKLTDLKSGMHVFVSPHPAVATQPAKFRVEAITKGLLGKIVRVDGSDLILQIGPPAGEPKEVTVATDANTKVLLLGDTGDTAKAGEFADLRPGKLARAIPETGTAVKIIVGGKSASRPTSKPTSSPVP